MKGVEWAMGKKRPPAALFHAVCVDEKQADEMFFRDYVERREAEFCKRVGL